MSRTTQCESQLCASSPRQLGVHGWNPRTGSDLVSDVIADRVREQPLTRPTDVVFGMKNDFGLDISYRVAWLGVEKARGEVYGDHTMSFDQLRWYSNVVIENNPRSYINLDFDQQTGSFVRYFISFRACIDGFKHCRPLLFLDGTFLKGGFKGNMLAATVKNDNQARHLPITQLVDAIRGQLMKQMAKCEAKCSLWRGELCPKMVTTLELAFKTSRSWIVSQADENVFEVRSHPSVLVDIGARTCSCFQWQLNGFPCPHAIVAFRNSGKNIYDHIVPFYRVTDSGQLIPGLFTQFQQQENPISQRRTT
ncbi:hypothetical protein ACSBR1_043704 [Camellia fascicularis]